MGVEFLLDDGYPILRDAHIAEDHIVGEDGRDLEERAKLDPEDDTLLLRLVQRLRGPLLETGKGARPTRAR